MQRRSFKWEHNNYKTQKDFQVEANESFKVTSRLQRSTWCLYHSIQGWPIPTSPSPPRARDARNTRWRETGCSYLSECRECVHQSPPKNTLKFERRSRPVKGWRGGQWALPWSGEGGSSFDTTANCLSQDAASLVLSRSIDWWTFCRQDGAGEEEDASPCNNRRCA